MINFVDIFRYLLMGLSMVFIYVYIPADLLNVKPELNKPITYMILILFLFFLLLNYFFVNDFVRIIVLLFVLMLVNYLLFKLNLNQAILLSFISEIIIMVSELIFILFIIVLNTNSVNELVNSYAGSLMVNLVVVFIAFLIIKIPIIRIIYDKLLKLSSYLKEYNVIFIMIVILISINFIFASIYNKISLSYVVIMNVIISSVYLVICYKFLKAQNNYYKINNKYNNTLNSLREYEEVLDVYRVSNHENKNQLLTIRSMIVKKEKNIPEYIDKIIDNKIKDDEKLMFDTNTIPAGGLRAVIYSKLLVMKDKKIKFNLNVDYKVRTVDLIELGEDLMLDICKIIGVFLDNAIEAVLDLKKKNVTINLFTDGENLNIEISNNFQGNIDLTKIDDKGYTSKTKGHGYGLSLVKEIISKNNELKNERRINKNMFTQKLIIKTK